MSEKEKVKPEAKGKADKKAPEGEAKPKNFCEQIKAEQRRRAGQGK